VELRPAFNLGACSDIVSCMDVSHRLTKFLVPLFLLGFCFAVTACQPSASVPGPPNAVSSMAGNGQVVISWSAPTNTGGSSISSYSVSTSPSVTPPTGCTRTTNLQCTFTGLTNGIAYTFQVVATNASGTGPGATTIATPYARATPSAPRSVSATTGADGQSIISWQAPLVAGGSPVSGYTVTSSPYVLAPQACQSTTQLSCTFTGLSNGTTYTFTVQALNSQGTGDGGTAIGTPVGLSVAIPGAAPNTTKNSSSATSPGLYPNFSPAITDYVSRCSAAAPIPFTITVPTNDQVSVNGSTYSGTQTTVPINRAANQEFSFSVTNAQSQLSTYYVRCLPADFPNWSATVTGQSQSPFYITSLIPNPLNPSNANGQNVTSRPIIFDNAGVPVWWGQSADGVAYSSLLQNGLLAYWNGALVGGTFLQQTLGGVTSTFPASGVDVHDVQVLPSGDYLVTKEVTVSNVDLTGLGGGSNTSVMDPVIQDYSPSGALNWSWDTYAHIAPSQMDPSFATQFVTPTSTGNDVYHWNSIDPTLDAHGNLSGFTVSYRHLAAVFHISCPSSTDCSTGTVDWKIGGSQTSQSLTIVNDPSVFPAGWNFASTGFGGQHDARFGTIYSGDSLPSLTLYDNGTNRSRSSREVRYLIDANARTATLVENVSNSSNPAPALCCGSARKLAGGNWVVAFGGYSPTFQEVNTSGAPVFSLTFTETASSMNLYFLYRALPLTSTQVSFDQLRTGMNTIYGAG
jgi:Arylsulfotransferase (ASST)/Fibronectin type III domain